MGCQKLTYGTTENTNLKVVYRARNIAQRFFSVDPLTKKYPHYSPYSFSGNKVIAFVEMEGLEEFSYTRYLDRTFADPKLAKQYHEDVRPTAPYAMAVTGILAIVSTGGVAVSAFGWEAVLGFLGTEITEAAFESVTGIPVITEPFDIIEQGIKKGTFKAATDKLTSLEKKRAAEYLSSEYIRTD